MFHVCLLLTSSYTSLMAAPPGSSSGSMPPPGTIHWSGCRLLLTSSTCKQKRSSGSDKRPIPDRQDHHYSHYGQSIVVSIIPYVNMGKPFVWMHSSVWICKTYFKNRFICSYISGLQLDICVFVGEKHSHITQLYVCVQSLHEGIKSTCTKLQYKTYVPNPPLISCRSTSSSLYCRGRTADHTSAGLTEERIA